MRAEQRVLLQLSAALGAGDRQEVNRILDEDAPELPARPVEEALLQAHLFVGFPPVLEAFLAWRGKDSYARGGGVDPRNPEQILEDGRAACRKVYGGAYERLRRNVAALHPELDRWMIGEGYGKVLSRPGLDPAVRELCIVALLAGAGWPRQLHSHLRGALRLGAGEDPVEEALEAGLAAVEGTEAAGRLPRDWGRRARELWAQVRERHPAGRERTSS